MKLINAFQTNSPITEQRPVYPNLIPRLGEAQATEARQWEEFFKSPEGSFTEQTIASTLAKFFLARAALALQQEINPAQQQLYAANFTRASRDLYGTPEAKISAQLIWAVIEEFRSYQDVVADRDAWDLVITTYNRLVTPYPRDIANEQQIIQRLNNTQQVVGQALEGLYGDILAIFNGDPNRLVDTPELFKLFQTALAILAKNDTSWSEWQVVESNGSSISYLSVYKVITVPHTRAPTTLLQVKGTFAHEVLAHALGAVNSSKHPVSLRAPNHLDADEGLACLIESAAMGIVPDRIPNRYIDIAFALGVLDGESHSRQELYNLALARAIVRNQVRGSIFPRGSIELSTMEHVNRVFGGTLGLSGKLSAVFTKDLAYYRGLVKIADYIACKLDAGYQIKDILQYLLLGKFDPTNQEHRKYVFEVTGIQI